MKSLRFFGTYSKEFLRHWGSYVWLFIGSNLLLTYLVIPVCQWLTAQILRRGQIYYVSNTNLLNILQDHPVVLLALFLLLAFIFVLIFWQFSFQLIGMKNIQTNQNQSLYQNFKAALAQMKRLRPSTFIFFLFYFVLILPFANLVFRTPLLNKVTIPIFILDTLMNNLFLLALLVVFWLGIYYLGLRLLFVLPLMIFEGKKTWPSVTESWQMTRNRFWHYVLQIFLLSLLLSGVSAIGYQASYLLQLIFDLLPSQLPLLGALLNLTSAQLFGQFLTAWGSVLSFSILVQKFYPLVISQTDQLTIKWALWTRIGAALMIFFFGGSILIMNGMYLTGLTNQNPLVISHRGVDNGNGVQNTIEAMAKTIKEKPDYIEMDIHETKDHQFVVMHDENLKVLAGVNKASYQLTLAELTKLTVKENGQRAKIASFDDYLVYANQHSQKLLIEIKTTNHDSKDMLQRFIQKYQGTILKNQHRIHSLDYNVVDTLKKQAPKLFVSFILPYNLIFPQTVADAYTMEETTLTSDFVADVTAQKKAVYAWTVNTSDDANRMLFMGVDGIISDDMSLVRQEIKKFQDNPSYAQRIQMYIDRIPSFDQRLQEN